VPGSYWFASGNARQPYQPRPDAAASFRFVDDDLRDALQEAAARLRGGVYVITSIAERDLRASIDFTPSYEDDELQDWFEESDAAPGARDVNAEENKKHYRALTAAGIWVRGHPQFHAKFLVADDRVALVSSANLESAALVDAIDRPGRRQGFDPVTAECGIVTSRPADAQVLGRFFARLWYGECRWDAPPGKGYQLSWRTPVPRPFEVPVPWPGEPGPIWTGGGDRLILDAIQQICGLARDDLVLASFSTKGLEDHPDLLFDPVRAAIDRGTRVRLLLRSRNFAAARATAGLLAGWGVDVRGDEKTHAKCAIADGRFGAVFSANFDAEHGIYQGVEMGVRLDGEPVLADVAHFFEHCLRCAPHRLVAHPGAAAAARFLVTRDLHRWPLPAELEVSGQDDAWAALGGTVGPVLYTARGDGDLTLHVDGGRWRLTGTATGPVRRGADPGRWRLTLIEPPTQAGADRPAAMLDQWLEPGRRATSEHPYRDHQRGLCPATLVRATPGR
jgi:hypothetical protein